MCTIELDLISAKHCSNDFPECYAFGFSNLRPQGCDKLQEVIKVKCTTLKRLRHFGSSIDAETVTLLLRDVFEG